MFSSIFRRSSKTYFYSSLFFPPHVRHDVTKLYEFVRLADNYVDATPQDARGFETFCEFYRSQLANPQIMSEVNMKEYQKVTLRFVSLMRAKQFDPAWVEAFLGAMQSDLNWHRQSNLVDAPSARHPFRQLADDSASPAARQGSERWKGNIPKYKTYTDLQIYMYGSAGVIGLMMAQILQLPKESYPAAQLQGEAMQLINFVRDIAEDLELGRIYVPEEDLKRFGVDSSSLIACHSGLRSGISEMAQDKNSFTNLIRFEIDRYRQIQNDAEKGYPLIPRRYRIAVKTAADMYRWTANKIYNDPTIVWRDKVRPKKRSIFLDAMRNIVTR